MRDESPFAEFIHTLVFVAICVVIILVGWQEPLRYRFMSAQDIADENAPAAPEPVVSDIDRRPEGTTLDRGPYNLRKGDVSYSHNLDPRQIGPATETGSRRGTRRP